MHSRERIQKVPDSLAGAGYVCMEDVSGKKNLRIQRYPDKCVDGTSKFAYIISCILSE